MRTINITSKGQQTNSGWNRTGCTNWWAAYDVDSYDGKLERIFIKISARRGDRQLDCTVEVPDEVTEILIGAGKAGKDAHRETIAVPVEVAECPVCRKSVNTNDIHPSSERIPTDGQYVAYHIGCANGEDCVGGGDITESIDDSRAWIKLS
jgi:hypothetical protein